MHPISAVIALIAVVATHYSLGLEFIFSVAIGGFMNFLLIILNKSPITCQVVRDKEGLIYNLYPKEPEVQPLSDYQPDRYCRGCGQRNATREVVYGSARVPCCKTPVCLKRVTLKAKKLEKKFKHGE